MEIKTGSHIPFEFVLDHLAPLEVTVKPMFGLYAIYVHEKIMLVLRDRKDHADTNGVWVATNSEYHKSLKTELPSLRSFSIYAKAIKETEWQLLPVDSDDFEACVIKVCELIKRGDPRIGRMPKPGKSKARLTRSKKPLQ
jgi:hypothetical protein